MSKHAIREDKTCLNCGHFVELKFCPNCGQENTDTRKTFYHLFVHFFEDLTHYENAFWKTIRNLLFKPATLTKEYLSGKRLSYLAPVRLYIFISFITFLFIAIFPSTTKEDLDKTEKEISTQFNTTKAEYGKAFKEKSPFGLKTMKEIDSIQKYGKEKDKLTNLNIGFMKELFTLLKIIHRQKFLKNS